MNHRNARRALLCAAAATVGFSALPAFAQGTASCAAADERQVAALFDRWNASLATLDPDKVTANYASDAVLLPTVSNQPRTNPAEIRDYFVKFLKNGPQGRIDKRTIKIGCNLAQDVGIYTFRFKDGQSVQARYTYVYGWANGQWLIAHHHSSAMPEATRGK
jgi:uncharacterized protein (TIGR02246 family)